MNSHTIRRQVIDLVTPSYSEAFALTEQTGGILYTRVLPVMDAILSRLVDEEEVIHLARVELDLGIIHYREFEEQFVHRISTQLEKILKKKIRRLPAKPAEGLTPSILGRSESRLDILGTFLETGGMPWWSSAAEKADPETLLLELLVTVPQETAAMLRGLTTAHSASQRIVKQFSVDLYARLVNVLAPSKAVEIESLVRAWITLLSESLNEVFARSAAEQLVRKASISYLITSSSHDTDLGPLNDAILQQTAIKANLPIKAAVRRLAGEAGIQALPPENRLRRWFKAYHLLRLHQPPDGIPVDSLVADSTLPSSPELSAESPESSESLRSAVSEHAKQRASSSHPVDRVDGQHDRQSSETPNLFRNSNQAKEHDPRANLFPADPPTSQIDADVYQKLSLDEGAYIENAGLVILWPFLPNFFEKIELVSNQAFRSETDREHGVLLLQYLVTGETEWFESVLLLNKLLCGRPPFEPVNKRIDVSDAVEAESIDMLSSVISNWRVLKNTSIDGLRRSFLQREGRLSKQEQGWQLTIDRKGYDVLVDKLPWGIGLAALPWMDMPLWIEW